MLEVLGQRAETLQRAAGEVMARPAPPETTYTPISTADAVIRYAENFVSSWAGAIAIDLLPAVLVFILAVTQAAIRSGRDSAAPADTMTVAELRSAVAALREVDQARPTDAPPETPHAEPRSVEGATPLHRGKTADP